jgi:hypothetical protein
MTTIKRLYIAKKFSEGEPFRFATVYFNEGRGGWIFNCNLPGRRPSRKAWSTPWGAIPRWVKGQDNIHFSMITNEV